MPELPIVENAYRDFLAKEHELHHLLHQAVPHYMDQEAGGADVPEQVVLPGAIPWSLMTNLKQIKARTGTINPKKLRLQSAGGFGDEELTRQLVYKYYDVYGEDTLDGKNKGDSFWLRHLFYSGYARTRHTYHIEPALWEELSDMEWPADSPAEALKYLPLPSFAMRAPDDTIYTVAYDLLSGREESEELELRVSVLEKDRSFTPYCVLHLVGTIDEAVDQAVDTIVGDPGTDAIEPVSGDEARDLREEIRGNAEKIINLLLYLAGEDDIVDRAGHYPGPFHRHQKALSDTEYEGILEEDPSESDVGVRMQKAFRQYKEEIDRPESDGDGSKKAPHIRRPHPHLYWTGPGREIPKVKYLGPTPVNMDEEENPDPTVQDVD